ncbi:winged helix-turn-helix domain-containing protein [Streptomyces sp. NPDC005931]|uniref:winged helix-turn-helix domain-containing protein n=1 Tax=Streptomyces sp. NPDC005931 TaxID=3364737 RepID=UPI00367CE391
MTTARPAQAAPHHPLLPDAPHLRLVGATAHGDTHGPTSAALVGYLVLVPEGTDPTQLFAKDGPRPEVRPVTTTGSADRRTADDGVRVDPARRVAEVDGHELDLTYLEFELLAHLVQHPDHVQTRGRLVAAVWGYDHIGDGRTVDVHIARLRRKLGASHRHRIVTVRRVGYTYVPGQQESSNAALGGRL